MIDRLAAFFLHPPDDDVTRPQPRWAPPAPPDQTAPRDRRRGALPAFARPSPDRSPAADPSPPTAQGPRSERASFVAGVLSAFVGPESGEPSVGGPAPLAAGAPREPTPWTTGLRSAFVGPGRDGSLDDARAEPASPARIAIAPRVVMVVGEDAVPAALAVCAVLRRAHAGTPVLVLAGGSLPLGPRPPATPAATRVANLLRGRDHAAEVHGRAVVVRSDDPSEVVRIAAATAGPTVTALASARTEAWDRMLAAQDAVVLAPRGPHAAALLAVAAPALRERLDVPVLIGAARPDRRTRREVADQLVAR